MTELWEIENAVRAEGFTLICGVDEAGRGPLAGPVCAGAVILPPGLDIPWLNDSKKLTAKRREALFPVITENAISYGIAFASVGEIESLNILNAAMLATEPAFWDERYFPLTTLHQYLQTLPLEQVVETVQMRLYLLDAALVPAARAALGED